MKIIYKVGDFLEGEETIVCHSCNIAGGFKSGAARAVREKYPEAYDEYKEAFADGTLKLGNVQWVYTNKVVVGNMLCQASYGYDGKRYVSYDAVDEAMKKIEKKAKGKPVAFTMIGSVLGGGSWSIIKAIIEDNSLSFQPVIYVLRKEDLP